MIKLTILFQSPRFDFGKSVLVNANNVIIYHKHNIQQRQENMLREDFVR